MESFFNRFRQYPPAMQWLLVAAAAAVVLLAWYTFVWEVSVRLNERADEYLAAIERAESSERRMDAATQAAIVALGAKAPMSSEMETAHEVLEVVNSVLNTHRVTGRHVSTKARQQFRQTEMPRLPRGQKLITEVRFEAPQEAAYKVIADLEQNEAIETVSKVQIARSADPRRKTLVVQLTVEAWALPDAAPAPLRRTAPSRSAQADRQEGAASS